MWCVFFKPCMKLTLHCIHRSGHLKAKHTDSLLLLRRHLGKWSRGTSVSMRYELLVSYKKSDSIRSLKCVLWQCGVRNKCFI
jgi:hypothetical protein